MIPIVPQPPAWFVQVPLDSKLPDVPVLLRLGCSSQHQARRQHELATAQQVCQFHHLTGVHPPEPADLRGR